MRLTLAAFALLVLGLSFLPVVVVRAVTPIQTKTNTVSGGVTSNAITFDSTPTLANLIVCGLMSGGPAGFSSIVGGTSGWTQHFAHTSTNQKLWVYDGPSDGTSTVTFNTTSTSSTPSLICAELDGAYTYDSVAAVATGTTTTVQTNTIATVAAQTFLFAVTTKTVDSTTGAPSDSFNAISYNTGESNGRYAGAYRNVTLAGSYSTSWATTAVNWATTIVAYADPDGAPPVTGKSSLSILGVGSQ